VLGTEEHTHGVTAPDLGFGAWRASTVLAAVTGREPYPIERRIAFQTFGLPAAH
jgi:lysine N6-hydroxylase